MNGYFLIEITVHWRYRSFIFLVKFEAFQNAKNVNSNFLADRRSGYLH